MASERVQQKVRTIEKSITIRADAEEVYYALTDPDELGCWFPEKVTNDPEIGGKYDFKWNKLKIWTVKRGIYTDIIPGIMVAFTWPVAQLNQYSIVTFYLHSQGDETTIIFSHEGFEYGAEWEREYNEHSQLWDFFLENLRLYIEEGVDKRSEKKFKCTAE